MTSTTYDRQLTRQKEAIEIDVKTTYRTFSTYDDPLKYLSAETAKQYVEECIKLELADGWVVAPSHHKAGSLLWPKLFCQPSVWTKEDLR